MVFDGLDLGFLPVHIKLDARSVAGAIIVDGHVMPLAKNERFARAHLYGVIGPVMNQPDAKPRSALQVRQHLRFFECQLVALPVGLIQLLQHGHFFAAAWLEPQRHRERLAAIESRGIAPIDERFAVKIRRAARGSSRKSQVAMQHGAVPVMPRGVGNTAIHLVICQEAVARRRGNG